ncbi:hypothetical protein CHX27_07865 [Flavobacterium aurantiibacter]|uniref:Uncharacterized protein n=1 Tax=Flavobacterium aurantiibacter TaxID=2023067 RepID=A0A255ZS34_9FLAO|nr:hypothetical protein CHX27_07865 [Flavobacterium aurantiibacter]
MGKRIFLLARGGDQRKPLQDLQKTGFPRGLATKRGNCWPKKRNNESVLRFLTIEFDARAVVLEK